MGIQSRLQELWSSLTITNRRYRQHSTFLAAQVLEDRTLLATRVWDGGALANDRWSDADNWQGNVVPQNGDTIVFPTGLGALDRSTKNDLSIFEAGKIIFEGADYKLTGNRLRILDDIESRPTSGTNTIELTLDFRSKTKLVTSKNQLVLEKITTTLPPGAGDVGRLELYTDPGGEIVFSGTESTTYSHPIHLVGGVLTLAKTNGAKAIVSPLFVGRSGNFLPGLTRGAFLRKSGSATAGQFGTTGIPVTIDTTLENAILDIGNTAETVGNLTMMGGTVRGNSRLKLLGECTSTMPSFLLTISPSLIETKVLELTHCTIPCAE